MPNSPLPSSLPKISISIQMVLLVASSMTVMAGATIAPALPSMQRAFADVPRSELLVQLVLTVPGLFMALGAPLSGLVIDRFRRLPVLFFGLVLYGVAGTSGYFLDSLYAILVGRAVLGIAVAAIMTSATTLIADYFPGPERGRFLGFQASFMAFGGVFYLLAGGALVEPGWRYPFLLYLASLILLPAALAFLFEPPKTAPDPGADKVVLPPDQKPVVVIVYGAAFLGMALFYMVPVQIPFLLGELEVRSEFQVSMAIATATLSSSVVSLQFKQIIKRIHHGQVFIIQFSLLAAGYLVIFLAESFAVVVLGLAVSGAGLGLMLPNMSLLLISVAPPALRGRVVGGLSMFIFLGMFFSPLMSRPVSSVLGLSAAFGFAAGVLGLAAVFFLLMRRRFEISSGATVPSTAG